MAREGTRSATGNSKPRIFPTVDTAPAISRKSRAPTLIKKEGAKPAGVTKKKGATKSNGVAKKAKAAIKKVEAKVKKVTAKKPKVKKTAAAE